MLFKRQYYLIERAVKRLLETYGSYANIVAKASLDTRLQQQLFDAVTINETYFFPRTAFVGFFEEYGVA